MWEASLDGLIHVLQPHLLLLGFLGIVLGSVVAILPGIGSTALIAMSLPFAMTMGPYAAIAFLVSIDAVSSTGSTITSVLTGIPGSSGSLATVVDGYPMTKRGEGARAIGAGLCVSALGGVFGAVVLTFSLPVLRPLVLSLGSPEYFMLALWGISMVGVLSGKAPIKGIAAGILGVIIMTVGMDPKSGVPRYTFGQPYLWDGIPLILVALGIYGIPETIAMAAGGTSIAQSKPKLGFGLMEGVKDGFRHWFLTLRASIIGTWIGFVPGIGGPVAAWLAYGHAAQTCRNGKFGQGDIRGVIAPEAANNSVEGGSYITALAFGIPGSTATALILIAFMAVGLTPGPSMLTTQLNYVFAVIWTLVISNIVAAVLCLALAKPISKMAFWPFHSVVPVIVVLCFIGAFSANFALEDVALLLIFSVLGWFLRQLNWPRPPVLLGIVLGPIMEKYLWLSSARYGFTWLYRPGVILLLLLIVGTVIFLPLWNKKRYEKQLLKSD
ncbi:MAG: tripartite tricarboxylate transporter permease [Desulfobacterales bacterium]|nr:tripartite tricarboxylate transporter permease [Desulfobacterales bacterium]